MGDVYTALPKETAGNPVGLQLPQVAEHLQTAGDATQQSQPPREPDIDELDMLLAVQPPGAFDLVAVYRVREHDGVVEPTNLPDEVPAEQILASTELWCARRTAGKRRDQDLKTS